MTETSPPQPPRMPPATTRSALPTVLSRAAGLLLAFGVAWLVVDRGLTAWVQHEDAIVGQVARYVPRPDPEQLAQPPMTLGESDAPMSVVLACDLAVPRCRQQLATLLAWQRQPSPVLLGANGKGEEMRRLILLVRTSSDGNTLVAQTLRALDSQGQLWRSVPVLAQDRTLWTPANLDRALHVVDLDPKRLARDRDDPETLLAVRVEQTMAEALEIPADSGVLAAGLPVPATQSEGPALLAALDASEAQLADNLKFFGGDVALAQARGLAGLSPRTRDRFVRWILVGKKVSSLPGAAQGVDPAESDEGEEDEAP